MVLSAPVNAITTLLLASSVCVYAMPSPAAPTHQSQSNATATPQSGAISHQDEEGGQHTYTAVIAFGDSFTDNGHGAWVISNHTWPPHPGYDQGRFSNGPVWVEYVAGNLSVPLFDYAIGGATASGELVQGFTGPGSSIIVPSIDEQVAHFLASPPPELSSNSSSRPLFFLLGGANDVLFNPNITASRSFQELLRMKSQLQTAYPQGDFVFLDYPDLARIPYSFYLAANGGPSDGVSASVSKRELATFSRELKGLYEDLVLDGIRTVSSDNNGDNVRFVDVISLFDEFDYYGEPLQYGFDPLGAYSSCLVGIYQETGSDDVTVCEMPDTMVFWDEYHPTTHAHSWIARRVLDVLGI